MAIYSPCAPGSQVISMQQCFTHFTNIIKISSGLFERIQQVGFILKYSYKNVWFVLI